MTQAFCRVIIIEALDNICHLGIISVYYAASIGNGGTVSDLHLASLIDIGLYRMQLHVLVLHRTVILYKQWQTSKPPFDRHVLSATHRFVSGFRDRRGKGELELARLFILCQPATASFCPTSQWFGFVTRLIEKRTAGGDEVANVHEELWGMSKILSSGTAWS